MKYSIVLSLAAVSSAFVLPSQEVFADIAPQKPETWYDEAVATKNDLISSISKTVAEVSDSVKSAGHQAYDTTSKAFDDALTRAESTAADAESWLDSEAEELLDEYAEGRPPHHKRPHRKHPHHGHCKPNATVYELINGSKYTTKLAFFINQYPDLVKTLNSTGANFTIFAPTDKAFEKIPDHAPKPSKEELLHLLSYHVVPGLYPAGRVLATHTLPTLYTSDKLGKEPLPQRLSIHLGLTTGLSINFYSKIFSVNHLGSNGIIHAISDVLVPPPKAFKIIDLLPGEFSTLELALGKTGLIDGFNSTKHPAGTLFAPSNRAFQKLGPRINAFLFSQHGLKYLKALLEYHVAPKNILYSDAFYSAENAEDVSVPKGRFHVDLPTLLKDRSLSIDVGRFGPLIDIRINSFARVAIQDGIAADGVIQVVGDVLIPPRKLKDDEFDGELEVEDLIERLEPFVSNSFDL